jgi:hypothetical protein
VTRLLEVDILQKKLLFARLYSTGISNLGKIFDCNNSTGTQLFAENSITSTTLYVYNEAEAVATTLVQSYYRFKFNHPTISLLLFSIPPYRLTVCPIFYSKWNKYYWKHRTYSWNYHKYTWTK